MQINLNFIKKQLSLISHVSQAELDLLTADKVSEQLTSLGLEIDDQKNLVPDFHGVKVGKVIECNPHPDADKLQITKVDVGDQVLDIVCGAKNCKLGLLVACATPGAVLPNNFEIKQAKLRGVISNGMLCSFTELGISIEEQGIIELPADAPIGQDIREYLNLNDTVYEVSITPNRADCLSALGLARDLAAFNNFKFLDSIELPIIPTDPSLSSPEVVIEATNKCPVYFGCLIKGVNIKASTPIWMKLELAACGIRSIDPIVDVTNYVLLTIGQPLHAFNANKVDGKIVVRTAKQDEKLVLLSEQEVILDPDVLVIADNSKALALAGIFGGLTSGTDKETTDIILEAAFFEPLAITGRARKFKLHTDASHRFERGVDPQLTEKALNFATDLILQLCGGTAAPFTKAGEQPSNSFTIILTKKLVDRIAGIPFSIAQISDLLQNIGVKIISATDDHVIAQTPSWRFDLQIPEDLAEEVIRINGFDKIPTVNPVSELQINPRKEELLTNNFFKDILVKRGFQEIISYSFVDPKLQAKVNKLKTISLPNPISVEMSEMRTNLLTGLISTLAHNQKRQQQSAKLFEMGLTFIPDSAAEMDVKQDEYLALLITGKKNSLNWNHDTANFDFYDLKGYVEDLLDSSAKAAPLTFSKGEVVGLHPGQTAIVRLGDKEVGFIGSLHPATTKAFDVKGNIYVAQLKVDSILQSKVTEAEPISKFPFNKRDLAFVVSKDVNLGDMLDNIKATGGKLLLEAVIFDVFTSQELAENQSVAVNLVIGDSSKTMEDNEINELINRIIENVAKYYNASLRE